MSSRKPGTGETICHECRRADTETRLHKCPVCFKYFCDEHTHLWSGRPFCSRGCAEYFYFGDEDAEE
jgi:hypothetical protein